MDVQIGDILEMKKSTPAEVHASLSCGRGWIFVSAASAAGMR